MPDIGDLSLGDFLALVNALKGGKAIVPSEDAIDLQRGADLIPFQVTDARRNGMRVSFIQNGNKENWYWQFPNGQKIYHGKKIIVE